MDEPKTATDAEPPDIEAASGVRLSPYMVALGPGAVVQVINRYLTNVEAMASAMRRAVEGGDAAALERAAHSLKGSSGTIGAGRLQQICRRLEERAGRGSIDAAEYGLEELRCELRQIGRLLRRDAEARD